MGVAIDLLLKRPHRGRFGSESDDEPEYWFECLFEDALRAVTNCDAPKIEQDRLHHWFRHYNARFKERAFKERVWPKVR